MSPSGVNLLKSLLQLWTRAVYRLNINYQKQDVDWPQCIIKLTKKTLIKIRNDDSFCLFYSLVATLAHGIFNWHWEKFSRYLRSEHGMANKFKNDTIELTESVGAPMDLGSYNAEYWVPHVVDFWNNKYAGQHIIKVFIFGSLGHYEPEYKYGPDNFDTPIILYYKDEHFDEEKKTGGLFGQPYCLYCEKVYERDITHKISCKARCLKCARVGPGFPCKMVAAFNKICQLCSKIFYNNNCYQHHLQSGFCRVSKQCEKCGVVWNVNVNSKNGRKGHICGERYCTTCGDYHDPKRGCYIKPMELKDNKKYRQQKNYCL